MEEKPIIMFCGLMGSGKTTLSEFYITKLEDYTRFNTDDVRRILGKTKFDRKDTPEVNEYMYSRALKLIDSKKGVMFDSAYKLAEARKRIYEIGAKTNLPVLIVECVCKPETAMNRIASRPSNDGAHKPTNNPEVYNEYSKMWEDPEKDLDNQSNNHLSLIKIDTDSKRLKVIKISETHSILELVRLFEKHFEEFINLQNQTQ